MKTAKTTLLLILIMFVLTACGKLDTSLSEGDTVSVLLSDEVIEVDGKPVSKDEIQGVNIANDIIYYEQGKDFTYGEGSEKDAHSAQEAKSHTVVHITQAGTYSVSGKLSKGQIAVDLGEASKNNPEARVTLILNGVDITCEVAPAIIFYNVYECGNTDTEKATRDVDTTSAGAQVVIADGTVNNVNGAYVEKIYKADTVVLNEDKTEVEDAEKLHKYDGAFYSKMSMNITGENDGSGILNINAENEGLDSELHLTINGGNINIRSGNDGINTNEDGVSVTTVNGGNVKIVVTGETGEGDGIDSNGWLVIKGGSVVASACSLSGDAGIDSDMGIHIVGGNVIATGNMLDRIEEGGLNYAVFNFAERQKGTQAVLLKNAEDNVILEHIAENDYSILVFSSPDLKTGAYTLWNGESQLAGQGGEGMNMRPNGFRPEGEAPDGITPPDGMTPPEIPEGEAIPEKPDKWNPEGQEPPVDGMPGQGMMPSEGAGRPARPEGDTEGADGFERELGELKPEFEIIEGANLFVGVAEYSK